MVEVKAFEPLKTTREERGKVIAESFGNIRRIDDKHYEVVEDNKWLTLIQNASQKDLMVNRGS